MEEHEVFSEFPNKMLIQMSQSCEQTNCLLYKNYSHSPPAITSMGGDFWQLTVLQVCIWEISKWRHSKVLLTVNSRFYHLFDGERVTLDVHLSHCLSFSKWGALENWHTYTPVKMKHYEPLWMRVGTLLAHMEPHKTNVTHDVCVFNGCG